LERDPKIAAIAKARRGKTVHGEVDRRKDNTRRIDPGRKRYLKNWEENKGLLFEGGAEL